MHTHSDAQDHSLNAYWKLAIALVLSLLLMYPLSMAFVVERSHF